MTAAAVPVGGPAVDRRSVLRAGVIAGVVVAIGGGRAAIDAVRARLTSIPEPLPDAAAWAPLIGEDVMLVTAEGVRTTARIVEVSPFAGPSPGVVLEGSAYSLLLHAPRLPDASTHAVSIRHPAVERVSLVVLPVDGDGSWQAIVDQRRPVATS